MLKSNNNVRVMGYGNCAEYSTNEVKKSVSRLSEAMRNTKVALQQREKSEWSAEEKELNRNSQKWLKKLEFRGQIFNKYKQRDTCAYVAARVPAVYCAVYRVLIEVHSFSFYFY